MIAKITFRKIKSGAQPYQCQWNLYLDGIKVPKTFVSINLSQFRAHGADSGVYNCTCQGLPLSRPYGSSTSDPTDTLLYKNYQILIIRNYFTLHVAKRELVQYFNETYEP